MNYLRYINSIMIALISFSMVHAARYISEKPTIDHTKVECIYNHILYDADLDSERSCLEILLVGDKFIQFMNYGTYRVDSTLSYYNIEEVPSSFYIQLLRQYPSYCTEQAYLIDKKNKTLSFGNQIPFTGAYYYTDSLTKIKWTLHNEERNILGYKCHKATVSYKGLNWTAWYTPDIRYGHGPGPLRDLPGLVLEAYDEKGGHRFEAIAIRTNPNPIIKERRFVDGKELQRKKFLEFNKDRTLHSSDGAWQAYYSDPENHPKPANKHFMYVPYELE